MTLTEWLDKNYKHVTLKKELSATLTCKQTDVDLTIALISTESKEEWAKFVFHLLPPGCIIDEIDDSYYEEKLIILRQVLTKEMLTNKNADRYLKILERRDKKRWAAETSNSKIVAKSDPAKGTLEVEFNVVDN